MKPCPQAAAEARNKPMSDPVAEGAHARAVGRPKDACPYPAGSRERRAWFEGP